MPYRRAAVCLVRACACARMRGRGRGRVDEWAWMSGRASAAEADRVES